MGCAFGSNFLLRTPKAFLGLFPFRPGKVVKPYFAFNTPKRFARSVIDSTDS